MRLCFVIQRYGLEVAGGAEAHCRWLAEHAAAQHDVEILTTTARDYVRWDNHYASGPDTVNGIPVTRCAVKQARDAEAFARVSDHVFLEDHTLADERRWVRENGPLCPALLRALRCRHDVDWFIFYCYRYWQTWAGLPPVRERAVLVPTAEEDPALALGIFGEFFGLPRGLVFLTPEERRLVKRASGTGDSGGPEDIVIGTGLEIPPGWKTIDVRERFDLPEPFLLYVGRIDRNKGVDTLFRYYRWLRDEWGELPCLVLVGADALSIPNDIPVRHLGFVTEEEKYALLAACEVVLHPSSYESLCISILEAWAMGRPVLVNGGCSVLRAQCERSHGGIWYEDFAQFAEALRTLLADPALRRTLGEQGRRFAERECRWSVVTDRFVTFLEGLGRPA